MTNNDEKHEHQWGEWERVVDFDPWSDALVTEATPQPTGDRARECRVCGRWDIEWATT